MYLELVIDDLKNKVHGKLKTATSVIVAVAYFRPDNETLNILMKIPEVKIIVSKEFDKSDPYKLEHISKNQRNHTSKCIPIFPNRLHAKVIYGEDKNGKSFAFLGSANITSDGLSQNREATILLDSSVAEDNLALQDISMWLKGLYRESSNISYDEAKKIHDNALHFGRGKSVDYTSIQTWVIKTRDGQEPNANDYWSKFRSEKVIALGWGGSLKIDPRSKTYDELRNIVYKEYETSSSKAGRISTQIKQFTGQENGININDTVWIIGSFTPNQKHPVNIYGVAKVTGELECDWGSSWWNYKRKAKIFPIEQRLDIEIAKRCFISPSNAKEYFNAMQETLYHVHNDSFERLSGEIFKQHGVSVNL